jgi:UDP-2-acetamido-3-amino-2,3-dideoxy-glucuronate N-acetyltransferase
MQHPSTTPTLPMLRIAPDVRLGHDVKMTAFVNLHGCEIGSHTSIGCFVEIQDGVKTGERCRIASHAFLCEGVTLEDDVHVGNGVIFTHDRHPQADPSGGMPAKPGDWGGLPTLVRRGASVGAGAIIAGGVVIGEDARVAPGSVVTHDVPPGATVAGNPARAVSPIPASDAP